MNFTIRIVGVTLLFSSLTATADRTSEGLRVLYDFKNAEGEIVKDQVGDLDLKISNPGAVKRSKGALEIHGNARARSINSASALSDAIEKSGAFTIETWIRPVNTKQEGPARIVTFSRNANERNFTLGQEKDRFDVRLRTSKTSQNGTPSISTGGLGTELAHVVYTREKSGRARLFVNGKQQAEKNIGGDLKPWSENFHLALGDEMTGGRQWRGSIFLVAIFDRALSDDVVKRHFEAGIDAKIPPPTPTLTKREIRPVDIKIANGPGLRTRKGLLAFYDFSETKGEWVRDRAGISDRPMDLKIENVSRVRRPGNGTLEILGPVKIVSQNNSVRQLTEAVKNSRSFSVEAWIRPANTEQEGPARIVSLSRDTGNRNFTLGQEKASFETRFRTTRTGSNGSSPALSSGDRTAKVSLAHVVYTRETGGQARFFVNGRETNSGRIPGEVNPWDGGFKLALANEVTGDRPWRGTFHLVAIFDRALTAGEVNRHFRAGPTGKSGVIPLTKKTENETLFETKIAPLLAEHCLECHDPATREGRLDLSQKALAFAGGKREGHGVVAGKLEDSSIWKSVVDDEMPDDREPLSDEEKALLKKWIEGGAAWTIEKIDPAVYAHGGDGAKQIWVQRLTQNEYIETVRAATEVDIAKEARELLPPDLRADGFSNTAYNLNVDLKHIDAYARLAELIVGRMDVEKFAGRFGSSRSLADDKKMKATIEAMGRWLLRGEMTTSEIYGYRGILTTVAAAGGDYREGMTFLIEAMLQSPRFIYRIERQRGDGSQWAVDDFELASRMSYIVWGGPPDRELFDAADNGRLSDPQEFARQIQRMLADERAVKRSRQFAAEWLNLGRLANLAPDAEKFPQWNPQLAGEMREETLAFFEHVVWQENRPLSELLNAQVTFAKPALAKFYGLELGDDDGAKKYDLTKNPQRGGLLTQASVLTVGGDEASMVSRGLFVMHDLLRGVVKDPPPCVDVTPVPSKPGLTQRDAAEDRIKNVSCGGCHAKFEPLAFGLEKFNGIGAFHEKDEFGNRLRDDGNILVPGAAESVSYENAAELMDLLAASPRVKETLTWKLAQFSLGRPLTAQDAATVQKIHAEATKNGGTYQATLAAILASELVRTTRTEK